MNAGLFLLIHVVIASHICTSNNGVADCTTFHSQLAPMPRDPIEWKSFDPSIDAFYPVLYGGVGNALFTIAAINRLSQHHGRKMYIGSFHHVNSETDGYKEWGGHPPPFPLASWCHFLRGVSCLNPLDDRVTAPYVNDDFAFDIQYPDEYLAFPESFHPGAVFLNGYFFNHKYWHCADCEPPIEFGSHVKWYVEDMYGPLFAEHQTVSVHIRLGYRAEPAMSLVETRAMPPDDYWQRAISNMRALMRKEGNHAFGKVPHFLVFSDADDIETRAFLREHTDLTPDEMLLVDENAVISVHIMSRCQAHILTSSTLSFWGAYLDRRKGPTLLHSSFFDDHGRGMIPPDEMNRWIVLE